MARSEVADFLRLKVESGSSHKLGGIIAGMREPVYFHNCKLEIENSGLIETKVGFMKNLSFPIILGRRGFFDSFIVQFDHTKNPAEFEITKIQRAS